MSTLTIRRLSAIALSELAGDAPQESFSFTDDHRASLVARFRATPTTEHRKLDAWTVESSGAASSAFRWSPTNARRSLGTPALRLVTSGRARHVTEAVTLCVEDHVVRAASGRARPGSLSYWLTNLSDVQRAVVIADTVTWATGLLDVMEPVTYDWTMTETDAYYDVATARVSLRGRRDLCITTELTQRVILRFRGGSPTRSAGMGLRADLVMDGLSRPDGQTAQRFIGVWPDAGLILSIDGNVENARAGARSLVRTAMMRGHLAQHIAA